MIFRILCCLVLTVFYILPCSAQGTVSDYRRAKQLMGAVEGKLYDAPIASGWSLDGKELWYEKQTPKGRVFILVNIAQRTKKEIFTLKELLGSLQNKLGHSIGEDALDRAKIKLSGRRLEFEHQGYAWTWDWEHKRLVQKYEIAREDRSTYWGWVPPNREGEGIPSPDGKWTAFIKDSNIFIRPTNDTTTIKQLTFDGRPTEYYSAQIHWSPDNKKIASSKVHPATVRQLTLVESSPSEQLQPKLHTRDYPKPGDSLTQYYPVIYNLELDTLFITRVQELENQFSISRIAWRQDSRAISFEYNKRGHQQYNVMELAANNGQVRPIITERSDTFIDYSGKRYRFDLRDGKEIIWASERDGWNHLYRLDGQTGEIINQITKGEWVVRRVLHVDQQQKQIIFEGSGRERGQDPYFLQYYSIDFDGNNLRALTHEDGNHTATFNPDFSYFMDMYSRIDTVSRTVLRDRQGTEIMSLESADDSELQQLGLRTPEAFSATGRDGQTDIWGIIVRPSNFQENKSYPIVEYIYAGPHSSFVPKSFAINPNGMQELAELGFIVVQIDGMGTSNRSKRFQDVCWKNLKDAGFADRILWIKAAAEKYTYMDTTRVGIYGTSAGGQSSAGALLFHPEFYKVAVSSCGCHDNRMDKIWWNEQWMGWPVGPEYAACSNIENAANLQGKLMLIVGELDDNVDPSSTYQFTNALIKAGKDHELIVVPGMGHSSGGTFGENKRRDFFVRHLLGVRPPEWDNY
ncbi:MAG: DPP IV N-terminal domain-containing protein [Sphingobacterium sp.]